MTGSVFLVPAASVAVADAALGSSVVLERGASVGATASSPSADR